MNRVVFKKLIVEGFGSIVDQTSFDLDRGGIWSHYRDWETDRKSVV